MTGKDSKRLLSPPLAPELDGGIKKVLAEKQLSNLEELDRLAGSIVDRYNRKPRDDFGGLSPIQVSRLAHSDWTSPESAIRLHPNLTLEELEGARILVNARLFLTRALEEGGIKATAPGNLNRKFVEVMLHKMTLEPQAREMVKRYNKVVNEEDVWPLHIVRILLGFAGLIWKAKGTFRLTKKGREMLVAENAGQLYALLFDTHFRDFNLGHLDRLPEELPIQPTIAYSLYQISEHYGQWQDSTRNPDILLLPAVREEIGSYGYPNYARFACLSRIVSPLEEFGLLEFRKLTRKEKLPSPIKIRKTELFDLFLKFEV